MSEKNTKNEETIEEIYAEFDEEKDLQEPLVVELRLDTVLQKRGMNQKELAELTGIRPAAISQLYRGFVDRLNLDHIARIANALGIEDIRELMGLQFEGEVWNMSTVEQQREYLKEKEEGKTEPEGNDDKRTSGLLAVELWLDVVLEERGMTQKQLAELTGIRPAAISQICRGFVERLNLNHIERIANALSIKDISELIKLQPSKSDRRQRINQYLKNKAEEEGWYEEE